MPSKTKLKNAVIAEKSAALPKIPKELLDQFVQGPMTAEAIQDASMAFKKALIERALGGELSHHLGYPPGGDKPAEAGNHRNGSSSKTVLTDDGPLRIGVPRDRDGSFEPLLIPKHERRFTGFDDKIVAHVRARHDGARDPSLPGRAVRHRGIAGVHQLRDRRGDGEVSAWQARPLEPMYPVVFFDALRVKIREDAVVRNKAIYLALGVLPDGTRDILGLWIENTEGAKFWMKVFNDLKTRGVTDILIAVTDGLKGIPEALGAVFPATTLQTCIVHLIRNSLDYASWKDRKQLAAALRPIYTAPAPRPPRPRLDEFERGPWGQKYPTVAASWRRAWDRVIPFFAFPPAVRRVIYTTNAIESLHSQLRKIIKTRGHFPSDDAATKLIWLALRNITADWGRAAKEWREAMNQFAILYEERFTNSVYSGALVSCKLTCCSRADRLRRRLCADVRWLGTLSQRACAFYYSLPGHWERNPLWRSLGRELGR
jgi:putative transposase